MSIERNTVSPRPAPIRKLDESVINRIAAGEIINRPSNALKELIENSLDAGSTSISIGIKDGGMKLLQIQDNGHGIRTEDMHIICERFTTSKLQSYEDLSTIQTYGFRGEALASISHVAHLSITTKQADSDCAYKANYIDGKLVPSRPGGGSSPEPCAGNNGTVITAEDLFYNIPSRKTALKNTRDEYIRIFEVASRYAVHNSGVAFTCRKVGTPKADLNTQKGATTITNIRQIFGAKIASSLVEVQRSDKHLEYEFKGYVSSATHEMHKSIFLLFINHRLVDNTPIKRAVESLYTSILPKASRPFAYLDLRIKPQNVDVNVHPTKREVRFLNEDSIVGAIVDCIHTKLLDQNTSRSFAVQDSLSKEAPTGALQFIPQIPATAPLTASAATKTVLANRNEPSENGSVTMPQLSHPSNSIQLNVQPKMPVNKTVRTDYRTRSLESFSFSPSSTAHRNRVQATIAPDFSATPTQPIGTQTSLHTSLSQINKGPASAKGNTIQSYNRDSGQQQTPLLSSTPLLPSSSEGTFGPLFTDQQDTLDLAAADSSNITSATGSGGIGNASTTLDSQLLTEFPSKQSGPIGRSYIATEKRAEVDVQYTSVLSLRKELQRHAHPELTRILGEHTFVGFVDDRKALIQYQTRLYMVDYCKVSYHLFYHRFLYDVENCGRIVLQPAPSIYELTLMAAQELGNEAPEKAAEQANERLCNSREMLEQFFSIRISDIGTIESLPMVVKDYSPDYDKLPLFLYNITLSVDWESESSFFKTFVNALATLYALEPPLPGDPQNTKEGYRLMVEHRIFPSLKASSFLAPNNLLVENALIQLVDLPDLYRIFERC
ncbi:DNA mismatch repair protein [Coemansia spiralis]|uniref:DNA mismatch repair protein n=2 Tax=Coemansia TaxID=4863 RepID=A0A9W8G526_9FUNG|nr:hypothetical protein BX070DRAFT_228702 [Coemansia spiralis]KAJ1990648.1 DNA mismatch repair protein [Coemansia umbellata]KAJ2622376.1 DNA mismatch repair protein [Coemansia sp. RSA 1358]KAJ2675042.1 DNA mismatch repair protein [Coemansia spiralis]